MTKEQRKAEELYGFFDGLFYGNYLTMPNQIKECAIKVCDEVINRMEDIHKPEYLTFATWDEEGEADTHNGYKELEFWQSVKQHLEQM